LINFCLVEAAGVVSPKTGCQHGLRGIYKRLDTEDSIFGYICHISTIYEPKYE